MVFGGGLANIDPDDGMNVSNCTIWGNIAGPGPGGIQGFATLKSTIVAGSVTSGLTPTPIIDVDGNFISAGFNFIGNAGGSSDFNQPTDQTGTPSARLDPDLVVIDQPDGFISGILIPRCGSWSWIRK